MRDDPDMGSITVAASLAIHGQTRPAADTGLSLFECNSVCFDGQLPPIQERGAVIPW